MIGTRLGTTAAIVFIVSLVTVRGTNNGVPTMSSAYARSQAGTWSVVPTPDRGTDAGLNATAAISATDAWAVGNGIIHHWNASAWRPVAGASIKAGVTWQLEAVAVIPNTNPAQLLAVGWTGSTRHPRTPPIRTPYRAVERLSVGSTESGDERIQGGGAGWHSRPLRSGCLGRGDQRRHRALERINWSRVRSAGTPRSRQVRESRRRVRRLAKGRLRRGLRHGILPWRRHRRSRLPLRHHRALERYVVEVCQFWGHWRFGMERRLQCGGRGLGEKRAAVGL